MLPVGVTGLVLAGLVAAIMSSIDSTLNSSSTLILKDFVERPGRELDPRRLGRIGRLTTLGLMALAAAWAPRIAEFGGLFSYLQQAFSILVPPVAAIFLFGVFGRIGDGRAAVATLAVGHAAGLALFIATQAGWSPLHFTINVGIMTALSALVFWALGRGRPAPAGAEAAGLIYSRGMAREDDLPLWRRPTPLAVLVLALAAALVLAFW